MLSFQEDAIGIRLRDVIGVDNMMWGSDYPHSELTFPQSRKILAEILAGVPDDEQAKIVGGNTARVYGFDMARAGANRPSYNCFRAVTRRHGANDMEEVEIVGYDLPDGPSCSMKRPGGYGRSLIRR